MISDRRLIGQSAQGLMQAESRLLEPWYDFRLEIPAENVGRAMSDLERMGATMGLPEQEGEMSLLTGSVPVECIKNYQKDVTSYTKGRGRRPVSSMGMVPAIMKRMC